MFLITVLQVKRCKMMRKNHKAADVLSLRKMLCNLMNVYTAFSFIQVETNDLFTQKMSVLIQDCKFTDLILNVKSVFCNKVICFSL